ncbi:MAG TPA: EAL domain-containing protein [Solirubrobacterales bacterium]|jgi:diguanylate cyclase (GGDEF)-like protein|nr:EAL domain-containing protein [Solirubrobacterales bacterium]
MSAEHSNAADGRARSPLPPSGPVEEPNRELRRLGEAMEGRVDDVLDRIVARTTGPGHDIDPVVQDRFERISRTASTAVARWIGGASMEVAIETGKEAWEIFGELAVHRAALLNEVVWRCFWWRNAMAEVLHESAVELGVGTEARARAMNLLQLSLEFNLLRMCECFETERQRTDEELTRREEELAFLATHDALTGLPNRTLILDRAAQMLARSRRHQTPAAALFIDIDNFKDVNDTLGHSVGDELLRAVAERLDGVIRDTDALGRLGGDEFVVISEELSLAAGPELVAERLLGALAHPFSVGEDKKTRVVVTASIGIAMAERTSAEELLRNADIAMYRAKWEGKNGYAVFATDMQESLRNRVELEMDLREALEADQFFLAYQPTIDLGAMAPTGVEALIRWRHPRRGVLPPEQFIPLLEETGLIAEVGRWVLDEACRQGAAWRAAGYPISMAVNVSGRQLDTDRITTDIETALEQSGLDPAALTVEVTETSLMRNVEETARRLVAIKALGVRIAIDDFGTGYSSLAHLQRFPVDALKIDRSFIAGLEGNREGETLIHSLVQLGKALSIETFAEGIEGHRELSLLREQECDSGQGFLFAKPLDAAGTEAFLRSWSGGAAAVPAGAPEGS